ncbi:MAG: YlbF family regulator [Spirochaetes bacterium]|jgi:uncharacterized protein YoxC|nr:YlbF family regulator [Spirochaetota bacterium]
MDECIELAKFLGSKIAENGLCVQYQSLSAKINNLPDKKKLLDDYESCVARINLLVKEEKDVPETLQNEYEQVATLVNSDNDLLMFISAQKGYLALVQSLIERIIPDQL